MYSTSIERFIVGLSAAAKRSDPATRREPLIAKHDLRPLFGVPTAVVKPTWNQSRAAALIQPARYAIPPRLGCRSAGHTPRPLSGSRAA
jgi:hypothetical protein